jgi:hypothetical protein
MIVDGMCDDCGMPTCMCGFYWKDGAVHGAIGSKTKTEEEKIAAIRSARPGNWGNPIKGIRRDPDGVLHFTLSRGGMVCRTDLEAGFPGCRVTFADYMGSLAAVVEFKDDGVHILNTGGATPEGERLP